MSPAVKTAILGVLALIPIGGKLIGIPDEISIALGALCTALAGYLRSPKDDHAAQQAADKSIKS